ncbi:hypothetical protein B5E84_06530 [Lachnoclostridium sp. An14]|nr:hypothetical protein B5E84_06530 [Lachnoclostridium sp. An14]
MILLSGWRSRKRNRSEKVWAVLPFPALVLRETTHFKETGRTVNKTAGYGNRGWARTAILSRARAQAPVGKFREIGFSWK